MGSNGRSANLSEVLARLYEQVNAIDSIHQSYRTYYAAAFDGAAAFEAVRRWRERTRSIIEKGLPPSIVRDFLSIPVSRYTVRGGLDWEDLCTSFRSFLQELIDDVHDHPEDFEDDSESTMKSPEETPPVTECDVFLSYSTRNSAKADAIRKILGAARLRCFMAEHNVRGGDRLSEAIRRALRGAGEVWLLVSPDSVKSAWVQRELGAAWVLEKRVLPILYRCDVDDLPDVLKDIKAIDFDEVAEEVSKRNG